MTKFEFVNHSSFILSYNDVSLASDPWIEGSVFNKSWDLLAETAKKSKQNLINSKYIWFSHEHPDHFNPKNLNIYSDKNNFIFQKTKDRRVVNYLSKISKNVIELSANDKINLSKDFSFKVIPFQYLDSFSIIKVANKTILNLNDCNIKNDSQLNFIKKVSGKIDVLLVQFSYATGRSNFGDREIRKNLANSILNKLSENIKSIDPKVVIPFASFCYFSSYDNFYLNDSINKIEYTINFLKKRNPNIMFKCFYPGDVWDLKSDWDNKLVIKKYNYDYDKIKPKIKNIQQFNFNDLLKVSKKFITTTKKNNSLFNLYNFFNRKFHKIIFKLTDLNKNYFFDFDKGLTEIDFVESNNPICKLDSESLYQLFSSGYGYDALIIGGRFEANKEGLKSLDKIFKFQAKNYQNIFYNYKNLYLKILNMLFSTNNIYHKR